MFILFETTGHYPDERVVTAIAASRHEISIEAYKVEVDAERTRLESIQLRLHELFVKTIENNPKATPTLQPYDRPKWPPGLGLHQITQAMNDERQAWEDHNRAIQDEAVRINNEWQANVWWPTYKAFALAEGLEVPEVQPEHIPYGQSYFEERRYHIEVVPEV